MVTLVKVFNLLFGSKLKCEMVVLSQFHDTVFDSVFRHAVSRFRMQFPPAKQEEEKQRKKKTQCAAGMWNTLIHGQHPRENDEDSRSRNVKSNYRNTTSKMLTIKETKISQMKFFPAASIIRKTMYACIYT